MGAHLEQVCMDFISVDDSMRDSSILAPAGHCCVLEPRWCEAVAQGHKFVEFVAYKKKWTNVFKFAVRGCFVAIGRQKTGDVLAVAVLNGVSQKKMPRDGSEVECAIRRVSPAHHTALREPCILIL